MDITTAKHYAETLIYNQLNQQAHLWAFIDSFRLYAVTGIIVLAFVFLMKKGKLN